MATVFSTSQLLCFTPQPFLIVPAREAGEGASGGRGYATDMITHKH
jgi:hypothetical protein